MSSSPPAAAAFPRLEQEDRLAALFSELGGRLRRLDRLKAGDARAQAMLKEVTARLKEAKALIHDFEREARTDGMPVHELSRRKRALALELNRHIAAKKARSAAEDARAELLAGAGGGGGGGGGAGAAATATTTTATSGGEGGGPSAAAASKPGGKSAAAAAAAAGSGAKPGQKNPQNQQHNSSSPAPPTPPAPPPPAPAAEPPLQALVSDGRKKIADTDAALLRAERLVEDTKAVGQQVAGTLAAQTQQLNAVADGLSEIEFTAKKAARVLRDVARGVATDRCVRLLLFLVAGGVIALVVVKVIKPNRAAISAAGAAAVPDAFAGANGTALAGRFQEAAAGAAASAGAALSGAAGAAVAAATGGGGAAAAAAAAPVEAAAPAGAPAEPAPASERRRRRRRQRQRRRRLAAQLFYGAAALVE